MALAIKVAFNTGIQVLTKAISTLLALASIALITRYLGSFGFGYYTTAITFVTFFSIAADFGMTLVTTQLISCPGANQNKLLSNLFTFRLVSALIILCLAPIIAWFLPYDPIVKQGIMIVSIALFFVLLNQVFTSLFQKELRADKMAYAEISSRILMFVFTIIAVLYGWGLLGILWAMVVGNVLNFLMYYWFAQSHAKVTLTFDKKIWQEILSLSWPFILTIVLNLVYLKTDTLLLSLIKSPIDVGLYGAAYRVVDVLVSVPFMLGGTVLPILAKRWHNNEKDKYQIAWSKIFKATSVLAWPIVIGGFVLATPIMILVGGLDFYLAGPILKVLIFAVGGLFFSAFFSYTMISFGYQKRLIKAYVFIALTSLILYLILIPKYSYFAAAGITVYSEIMMALITWLLVKQVVLLKADWQLFSKALVASIIMGLVVYYLPINVNSVFGLCLKIISGMVIYGLVLWFWSGLNWREIKTLAKWRD